MDAIDRLTHWMGRRNLTHSALALKLGVRQQTVSEWMNRRKRPSLSAAIVIHRVAGIRVDAWSGVQLDTARPARRVA